MKEILALCNKLLDDRTISEDDKVVIRNVALKVFQLIAYDLRATDATLDWILSKR